VLLPAAVLAVAAAVGALIAVLVSATGNDNAARSVTETVIRQRTVTAPAPPPPPPPAPPAPPAPLAGGHALNDQGYQLSQNGNYAAAIPLLQQAVSKLAGTGPADPYEAYANYNLGYALFRSGRCSEAISYLRRAQRLEPDRREPGNILRRAKHC
jgi:TolA-binding protein